MKAAHPYVQHKVHIYPGSKVTSGRGLLGEMIVRKHRPYHQHKAYNIFHRGRLHWPSVVVGSLFTSAIIGTIMLILAQISYAVQKAQLIDPSPSVIVEAWQYHKVYKVAQDNQRLDNVGRIPTPTSTPQPTPTQTPVKTAHSAPKNEITAYIESVFGADAETAKRVAMAESSLNPQAINHNRNGSYDYCLFQINSIHGYSKEWLSDYHHCVDTAYQLFKAQGWTPWNSSKHRWAK